MSRKPNPFGSTTEAIFQTLVRSALPLSTNDVYQSLMAKGLFLEIPARNARLDIANKLRGLKKRGVISHMDDKIGKQMWQLDPETRAALPPEKTAKPAKPKAAPVAKAKPAPLANPVTPKPVAGSASDIIFIPQPELTSLQTRISGVASVISAAEIGVLKLTWGNTLNLRDELLDAVALLDAKLEIPF